jgi:simple sugar transport system permease protein
MGLFFDPNFLIVPILIATFRMSVPFLLAGVGEVYSERSGVLNIGMEGFMLFGALFGYMVAVRSGSPWIGALGGMAAGGLLSLVHAYFSVTLGVDQIITGTGIWLFGEGITGFLARTFIWKGGRAAPGAPQFTPINIPGLDRIPFIGPILNQQNMLFYIAIGLIVVGSIVLFRTSFGLKIRAVGVNPLAADDAGVSVFATRYTGVLICGLLCGLAGVSLSIGIVDTFTERMTAGRGFITLAIVIFANWRPHRVVWGALLFAGVSALQLRFQAMGVPVPYPFMVMLPYVIAMIALVGIVRKVSVPTYLARPFRRA